MHTTIQTTTAWPLSKRSIIAICLLAPMAGGLALHLAYRRSAPAVARYANQVTLRALAVVCSVGFVIGMLCAALLPRR
jgi:hypothetical protein